MADASRIFCRSEKYQQLLHRHPDAFIRHVFKSLRDRTLSASEATDQLGLSRSRLYVLFGSYLDACAHKKAHVWTPGGSGGDRSTAWPQPVIDLLRKRLACSPPCPYSFAASEVLRLHNFKARSRAGAPLGVAKRPGPSRPRAQTTGSVRRWQRSQIGELWQLDASPHHWFPLCAWDFPMLNML